MHSGDSCRDQSRRLSCLRLLQDEFLKDFWTNNTKGPVNKMAAAALLEKHGKVLSTTQLAHAKERLFGKLRPVTGLRVCRVMLLVEASRAGAKFSFQILGHLQA